jgi:hypothetical protein
MFPQVNSLKLEADDEFIYVFDIDVIPATDKPDHPMVSVFITDMFIGEEVNPKKRHHQAYTPKGDKKPGVVYKRKYRKAEDRIQPIAMQLTEEFCIVHNITGDPLEISRYYRHTLLTSFLASSIHKNSMTSYNSIQMDSCGQKRNGWCIIW